MSRVLDYRSRAALRELSTHHDEFLVEGEFAADIGFQVLDELVALGLAEKGSSTRHGGREGWRSTADGWRCMYGHTVEEIAKGDKTIVPLRVWRWPPE